MTTDADLYADVTRAYRELPDDRKPLALVMLRALKDYQLVGPPGRCPNNDRKRAKEQRARAAGGSAAAGGE